MIPNMYRHQIDECIDRAREELKIYRNYRREDDAEHVIRRIQSLKMLREHAPIAKFGEEE